MPTPYTHLCPYVCVGGVRGSTPCNLHFARVYTLWFIACGGLVLIHLYICLLALEILNSWWIHPITVIIPRWAKMRGSWPKFIQIPPPIFHGVGGCNLTDEPPSTCSPNQLLYYLPAREILLWIPPLVNVVRVGGSWIMILLYELRSLTSWYTILFPVIRFPTSGGMI